MAIRKLTYKFPISVPVFWKKSIMKNLFTDAFLQVCRFIGMNWKQFRIFVTAKYAAPMSFISGGHDDGRLQWRRTGKSNCNH